VAAVPEGLGLTFMAGLRAPRDRMFAYAPTDVEGPERAAAVSEPGLGAGARAVAGNLNGQIRQRVRAGAYLRTELRPSGGSQPAATPISRARVGGRNA
jgi:hypothetical protein